MESNYEKNCVGAGMLRLLGKIIQNQTETGFENILFQNQNFKTLQKLPYLVLATVKNAMIFRRI